jgi:hypothetical protein
MANEFIIREGFNNTTDATISGSLIVTIGITGSLQSASYAITASTSQNSLSASIITNIASSSYSTNALSASYATGAYFISNDVTTSFAFQRITTVGANLTGSTGGMISPFPGPYGWQLARFNNINPIGTIYTTPIAIQSTIMAQKIGVMCAGNTANNSGRIDVGIYSSLDTMLPGILLASASISGSILTTAMALYTASLSVNTTLQKDNIYWLSMAMSGSSGQNFYMTYQWFSTPGFWISVAQNKLYNPLLGIQAPNSDSTYRQVAYYTTSSVILPATMSSTSASYSVLSYGTKLSASSFGSNIPIPPAIIY